MTSRAISCDTPVREKATRMMRTSLRLMDAVVELRDALPSQFQPQPGCEAHRRRRPRLIVLNRADQADAIATRSWKKALTGEGARAGKWTAKAGASVNAPFPLRHALSSEERRSGAPRQGQLGKASLQFVVLSHAATSNQAYRRLAGRRMPRAGSRAPGVTRGKQWITLNGVLHRSRHPSGRV